MRYFLKSYDKIKFLTFFQKIFKFPQNLSLQFYKKSFFSIFLIFQISEFLITKSMQFIKTEKSQKNQKRIKTRFLVSKSQNEKFQKILEDSQR